MQVIVRHEKHHTLGTLKASASHTMRTRFTANANPDAPAPEVWVGSSNPAQDVASVLPEKRRKNAVLSLEYLVTASPEFFEQETPDVWRKYLSDQVDMLRSYYGKENVVSVVLHQDEKTPHLSIQVVPLLDGKLNARALIGTREACRTIQDLAGEVGKPYGVLRGKLKSTAKHTDVRQWYQDLEPKMAEAKKSISKSSSDLSEIKEELEQAKDEKEQVKKTSKKLVYEAEVESKKLLSEAKIRIESVDSGLRLREEKVTKDAAVNEKRKAFLNLASEELKKAFRALPETVFLMLPSKLQDQLISVFDLNFKATKTADSLKSTLIVVDKNTSHLNDSANNIYAEPPKLKFRKPR